MQSSGSRFLTSPFRLKYYLYFKTDIEAKIDRQAAFDSPSRRAPRIRGAPPPLPPLEMQL
jgi:hypothetical protein